MVDIRSFRIAGYGNCITDSQLAKLAGCDKESGRGPTVRMTPKPPKGGLKKEMYLEFKIMNGQLTIKRRKIAR